MKNNLDDNEENFDKEFQFLYNVCLKSKYKVWLGKKLLVEDNSLQIGDNLRKITIDALFHSAAVDICKIVSDGNEITIQKFANKWKNKQQKELLKECKLDKNELKELKNRRNRNLAHADIESLNENISSVYPLKIKTLEDIINTVEKHLQILGGNKFADLFREIKSGDTKYENQLEMKLDMELMQIKNAASLNERMFKFLRKEFPEVLFRMIYSE